MRNETQSLQLQQKLIHYKSEAIKYKRELEDTEKKLLQLQERYRSLRNEKTVTEIIKTEKEQIDSIPFFSYATMLPELEFGEKDVQLLGNFVVRNSGNTTLTNPVICIRIKSEERVRLGGKISKDELGNDETISETTERWTYIEGQEAASEQGDHWLKPAHMKELKPGELLSFSQFDITVRSSCIIEGFVYFQEMQQGKTALNPIIVNF